MKGRTITFFIFAIVAAAFIISLIFLPKMPDKMASHWNERGEVDGYMSKTTCMFLMPLIMLGQIGLLYAIAQIDPMRKNIRKFFVYYEGFILLITGFLLAIHLFMIAWNLGVRFSINVFISLALGILFFVLGAIMPKLKPNWFMGIRTPWTLSNETVWKKTHELGGIVFKIAAIAILFGAVWSQYAIAFILIAALAASAITFFYSLAIYLKLK